MCVCHSNDIRVHGEDSWAKYKHESRMWLML